MKDGLIPYNVAANAEPPKVVQKEVESLQFADLPTILRALEKEPPSHTKLQLKQDIIQARAVIL